MNRLTREFYRQDAVTLARALLGKWLCRRLENGEVIRRRITETEAYLGEEDTACHAHKGRTERTDVMYAEGGCAYVYLCYGMYDMLNVVSGSEGHAEAVLIRGVEGYNGPGKLTKALGITRNLNREDLIASERLWLEEDGIVARFTAGPRVGIGYASLRDQQRKWRFTVKTWIMSGVELTSFRMRVYDETRKIPRGTVISYGELARRIGCRCARSVGQALRVNPFAPEVPCHRVVAADGSLTGFYGKRDEAAIGKKRRLLEAEGVVFDEQGRVADWRGRKGEHENE